MRLKFALQAVFLLLALSVTVVAHAQETEKPKYSPYYNGSFWEISVRGAPTINDDENGWALDVGLRQSFPLGLLDTRLSYRYDSIEVPNIAVSGGFEAHTLHLAGGFHPFYFFILGSDFWAYAFQGIYLEGGIGGQFSVVEQDDNIGAGISFVWTLGAGIDLPLWDPDTGYAPWLNLLYRYHATSLSNHDASLGLHTFFIGLGWRVNGLMF